MAQGEINIQRVAYQGGEQRNSKHEKETLRSYIDSPPRRPDESASGQSGSGDNEEMMMSLKEILKKEIEREQNMMYGQDKSDEGSSPYRQPTSK